MSIENIVLLSLDAVPVDHLSWHGYHRDTSPNLASLATDGIDYKNAYSASSHTRESLPSLLTGKWPLEAVSDDYRLSTATVAATLNGVRVAGFHSNPYVSRAFGYGDDFDEFDDDLPLTGNRLISMLRRALNKLRNRYYAPAEEINERALSWLDEGDEPFFMWLHYMDAHGPYDPPTDNPEQYCDAAVGSRRAQRLYYDAVANPDNVTEHERELLVDLYDTEIRVLDKKVGAFLDALDERGLLSKTLVILTADHGDAFGEHGYYGHPRELDDELIHVPLVCSGPQTTARTHETPVSTVSVVPTILTALTDDVPDDIRGPALLDHKGEDALDDTTGGIVVATTRGENEDEHLVKGTARGEHWRLDQTRERANERVISETHYALDSDDYRLVDEAEVPTDVDDRLRARLTEALDGTDSRSPDSQDVPDEVANRLEKLGYR